MLNKQKLEKMIREYIKIESPTPDELKQFQTLRKAYESVEKQIPNPPNLKKPSVVNINKVKNVFIVSKDSNMGDCIKEMLTNPLFIKQQALCGVCA